MMTGVYVCVRVCVFDWISVCVVRDRTGDVRGSEALESAGFC